jgi:hypothetical protein
MEIGMKSNHIDMTGQRFGLLTVVAFAYHKKDWATYWRCVCDCGREKTTQRSALVQGQTRSCGCLRSKAGRARLAELQATVRRVMETAKDTRYTEAK